MMRTRLKCLGRWTWTASFAFAALLFAPLVSAEETTESEKDVPSLTPDYPNEKPNWGKSTEPSSEPENVSLKKPGWYGRQVIGVTATFDALSILGIPAYGAIHPGFGIALLVTGMVGRSLSGPIVHRVHGQSWGHIAKSYALETGGVVFGVGMAFVMGTQCPGLLGADHLPPQPTFCHFDVAAPLLTVVPFALSVTGTILDSIYLVPKEPSSTEKAILPGFTVAPYLVPVFQRDERTGKQPFGMQFGFGGTF